MPNTGVIRLDDNINPQMIMQEGAGKAYQAVAQSVSIAIQDAVDNLRNINTVITTAVGVATAQMLAGSITPDAFAIIVTNTQTVSINAVQNLSDIGTKATGILSQFPAGRS